MCSRELQFSMYSSMYPAIIGSGILPQSHTTFIMQLDYQARSNNQNQAQSRPSLQQKIQRVSEYAAGKESFSERIKEELDLQVIKAPLTRENYKKKFHNMICWEEKRHIEILDTK